MVKKEQDSSKAKGQKLSMKEAFELLKPASVIKTGVEKKEPITFRDWVWNYPKNILTFFSKTAPLSFILLFILFGVAMFSILRSDAFADVFNTKKTSVFVEGSVGAVSSFNPLFISQSTVDSDIHALVFEKFIDISKEGLPVGNIAESWNVSSNGKIYEFTISLKHKWQDGEDLTLDDVIFTFETAKTLSKSHGYDTVGSALLDVEIEKLSKEKIRFVLPESNGTFFEVVSTYIVPKHILGEVPINDIPFNSFARYPIGSGPYMVTRSEPNVVYLKASDYYTVKPKIDTIIYRLYSDDSGLEAAFRNGVLDGIGGVNIDAMSFVSEYPNYVEHEVTLYPRIRMIFFNTRKEKLENKDIRIGLSHLVDKEELLRRAKISGLVAYSPVSPTSWAYNSDVVKYEYDVAKASEHFKKIGFVKNENSGYFESEDRKILSFTLSYFNNDFNSKLAEEFKELLREQGVVINLEPLTYTQLTQEIVATRDFELLMYEFATTIDPDQYNMWHSLKSNYPDLNLSGYGYERVDILLEEARRSIDQKSRKEKYILFQKYLTQDVPALFLYHPNYRYVVREGIDIGDISDMLYPYQRFEDVAYWDK